MKSEISMEHLSGRVIIASEGADISCIVISTLYGAIFNYDHKVIVQTNLNNFLFWRHS